MPQLRKGSRDLIREINHNLVLNLIKSRGPISRTEIAQLSGLSPATISGITADLMASSLVQETGEGEATRGRRRVLLQLNPRAGFVVGIKLMEQAVASALTDLDAQVLHYRVTPLRGAGGPLGAAPADLEAVLATIVQVVEQTIAESGVARAEVLGVGVGMAGLIDGEAGVCHYSPYFGWRNVRLGERLADRLDLPVYLENDVNTLTVAEQWFGYGHGRDHFAVVTVGRGIGAGIVVNGQFYRGALGGAGELGHLTLQADGPLCACGKRGCLESLASDPAVLRAARAAMAAGAPTALSEPLTLEAIVAAAEAGDDLARGVLADAGRWLGIGIAALVNLLNPQLLIVGGEGVRAGAWRLDPMRRAIAEHAYTGLEEGLEIIVEPSGDEAWARGAACVVLGELFKPPVHKRPEAEGAPSQ